MNFHLGKPVLVLLIASLLSGVFIAVRPRPAPATLNMWIFAEAHDRIYRKLTPGFEATNHVSLDVDLLNFRAETMRLGQLFMADLRDPRTPDLVEIEIGQIGNFFRPPLKEIGLRPLNAYLAASPWHDDLVKSRLATWSKQGVIFGMPHDVHPCTITYRADLFEQAGIDLAAAKTWPAFQDACVKFQDYWRAKGYRTRHALEMPEASSEELQAMLLQRGINPIDSYSHIELDDPRVAQTLAFYAQLVAGSKKCTAQGSSNWPVMAKDLIEGNICATVTPDWRISYIRQYAPSLSGKLRMMPLPVFDPTDAPTSTIGGTMIGITKASRHPDLAWKVIEDFYFSKPGLKARSEVTDILPPIKSVWADPMYHQPDPFFGGQKVEELYTSLAPKIPARYVTAATPLVNMALNNAVADAVEYVEDHGTAGLDEHCQQSIADVADLLRKRMKQWNFGK